MSPGRSAGQCVFESSTMFSGPRYQPSNGGISHTASAVNSSTSWSMS
jgi:hypothetical protein